MTKVLIVDDNPNVRDTLGMIFKDFICGSYNGTCLVFAASAEQAWQLIVSNNIPDLIITDLNMEHELAGIELIKKVKMNFPKIPVILMTSEPEALPFQDKEFVDYVVAKPFMLSDFVEKVSKHLIRSTTKTFI